METSCTLNSFMRRSAATANAAISCSCFCPSAANAQTVLARPCGLKSPTNYSTSASKTCHTNASDKTEVPKAHTTLPTSWGLNAFARHMAVVANAYNKNMS
eukprot:gnl/MRDRNA2_/MRDRNA2_74204_c0_seq3.p1 gnl/MRDRNA2_/MRDRNA2_74204_c0~~gnl/MRDRNA2_/MRDRNA2_74204_c0_seq3.p1  ORF type:complete len:101 (-),score=12.87 gnl/MRDRNA2_/MRDRNA2_74204_c0_seq3:364-666(-)